MVYKMSGEEFEEYLCFAFKTKGYKVEHIGGSHDFGADLILRKGNQKTIVQAKRYNKNVGIKAIQEVIAAKEYYKGTKAIVATNSYFTSSAKELAKKCNIELLDRKYFSKQNKIANNKPLIVKGYY